jgi:hypothetical protein
MSGKMRNRKKNITMGKNRKERAKEKRLYLFHFLEKMDGISVAIGPFLSKKTV